MKIELGESYHAAIDWEQRTLWTGRKIKNKKRKLLALLTIWFITFFLSRHATSVFVRSALFNEFDRWIILTYGNRANCLESVTI